MSEKPELERSIGIKLKDVMPERDEKTLENIAEDIVELTYDLEEIERIRKLVFGELAFVSDKTSSEIIETSQEIAEEILSAKED